MIKLVYPIIIFSLLLFPFCKKGEEKRTVELSKTKKVTESPTQKRTVDNFLVVTSPTGKLKGVVYRDSATKKYYVYMNGEEFGPYDERGGRIFGKDPFILVYNIIKGSKLTLFGRKKNYTLFIEGKRYELKNSLLPPPAIEVYDTGTYWFVHRVKNSVKFIINGKEIEYKIKGGVTTSNYAVAKDGTSWGFIASKFIKRKEWWAVINGKEYLHHRSTILPSNIVFSRDGSRWWWVIFNKNRLYLVENGKSSPITGLKTSSLSRSLTKLSLYVSDNGENKMVTIRQGDRTELWVNGKSFGIYTTVEYIHNFDKFWGVVAFKGFSHKGEAFVIINGKIYGPYKNLYYFSASENGKGWGFLYSKKDTKGRFVMINGKELGPYKYVKGPVLSHDGSKSLYGIEIYNKDTVSFIFYLNEKEFIKEEFKGVKFITGYHINDMFFDRKGRAVVIFNTSDNAILYIDKKRIGEFPRFLNCKPSKDTIVCAYTKEGELIFKEF